MFDRKKVLITSANLTYSGLVNNYEYGVLINDSSTITNIITDIKEMFENKEACSKLNKTVIEYIKSIISKIAKSNITKIDLDGEMILLNENYETIINSLSSWQKDVFICINQIKHHVFTLKQILEYKDILKKKHPNNNNVEAKVRQQLQILRDKGLIKFISRGMYKKLWE